MSTGAKSEKSLMHNARQFELEVCVDQVVDAMTAIAAGATRIEMNSALELDGLTPPTPSCQWLKEHGGVPILAMLRPHHHSFSYSSVDELTILRDCQNLLESGVDGIVFGSLDEDRRIALPILKKVIALCAGREVVFHRAFDLLKDQLTGLEQLIECGVKRVLTSGGCDTALEGTARLKELIEAAESRIQILPGAGVNSRNARQILAETGCNQLHGSFRSSATPGSGPNPEEIRATGQVLAEFVGLNPQNPRSTTS